MKTALNSSFCAVTWLKIEGDQTTKKRISAVLIMADYNVNSCLVGRRTRSFTRTFWTKTAWARYMWRRCGATKRWRRCCSDTAPSPTWRTTPAGKPPCTWRASTTTQGWVELSAGGEGGRWEVECIGFARGALFLPKGIKFKLPLQPH